MTGVPAVLGPFDKHCAHCDTRGADFSYRGWDFCVNCMSALTSWFLDGGMAELPTMFAYVLSDDCSHEVQAWLAANRPHDDHDQKHKPGGQP